MLSAAEKKHIGITASVNSLDVLFFFVKINNKVTENMVETLSYCNIFLPVERVHYIQVLQVNICCSNSTF